MRFYDLVKQTTATSSTNERKKIISEFLSVSDPIELKKLRYMLDPDKNYYFERKMIDKSAEYKKFERENAHANLWNNIFKFLDDLNSRTLSGNAAIEEFAQICTDTYACEDNTEMLDILLRPSCGFSIEVVNKVYSKLYGDDFIPKFQVQLADTFSPDRIKKYGVDYWYASRKLDGIRCYFNVKEGKLFSRSNKPHAGFDSIAEDLKKVSNAFPELTMLDGELFTTSMTFGEIQGSVSNRVAIDNEKKQAIKYNMFALLSSDVKTTDQMIEKFKQIKVFVAKNNISSLVILDQVYVKNNEEDIKKMCIDFVKEGYEGIILRNPNVHYDFKRSANLLKYKMFKEATMKVVGIYEGRGKYEGSTGGLTLVDRSGKVTCQCGSGLSDEMRTYIWNNKEEVIGKLIECKFQDICNSESSTEEFSLRFPIFRGFRDDVKEADKLK